MGFLSSVGSFLSSAGGASSINLMSAPLQYYYDRKMASKQNSYNISAWQMNNDYNTPANQLARLREAGINPNLFYGNGQSVAGIAKSPPQQVAPRSPDVAGALKNSIFAYQQAKLNQAQVEQANANRDYIRALTSKTIAETPKEYDGSAGPFGFVRPGDTSGAALTIRYLNSVFRVMSDNEEHKEAQRRSGKSVDEWNSSIRRKVTNELGYDPGFKF